MQTYAMPMPPSLPGRRFSLHCAFLRPCRVVRHAERRFARARPFLRRRVRACSRGGLLLDNGRRFAAVAMLACALQMADLESDVSSWALSAGLRAGYSFRTAWLDVIPHVGVR
ncbi:MAG: hypothetical protein K6F46_10855 [Desulfovibrio sp.]|nr:hypothetical protein [Desulfovibrio sp.]